MKITRLLSLSAVALLALTGCAKEVTYDDALKQTNSYGKEGRKAKIHEVVKVNKLEGVFEVLKPSIRNIDSNTEGECYPIKETELAAYQDHKFFLDGTKLEIKFDVSGSDVAKTIFAMLEIPAPEKYEASGKIYHLIKTNELGIKILDEKTFDINFSYEIAKGITSSGVMNYTSKVTYSLTNTPCYGEN